MTHSSNSTDSSDAFVSSDNDSSLVEQASLDSGLAALKQKDYPTAIVHLTVCQTSSNAATRFKAQMGLIKAYTRTHQTKRAIQLCQPLCQHKNPQVQAWANQTLAELTQRSADLSDLTELSTEPSPDATGFVPLAQASETTEDTTGFIPMGEGKTQRRGDAETEKRTTPKRKATELSQTVSRFSKQATKAEPPASPHLHVLASPRSSLSPPSWRNAGRSSRWTSLGKVDASGLWALQVGSIVLLFWIIRTLLQWLFSTWNSISIRINWITGIQRFILPTDLTGFVLILLFVLIAASPWLLDQLLKRGYSLQPLSLAQLAQSSPESSRLLKRVCGQRRQPIPTLGLLPDAAPIIFTYGYLPRIAKIAISQGLLNQLKDDEIAALVAAELAHIRYWDFGALSAIALVIQLPYYAYWQIAAWGDRQHDRVLRTIAAAISSLSYGLFWLLRLPGLWLSRVRLYYSDRLAADLTGNPNGLTRALLKTAIGVAQAIQQQQQTSALLESFEVLVPVGYRNALTIGSLYAGDAAVLEWDRRNPYRRWLILNNTHPSLGERLDLLMQYAQKWRLEPEVKWGQRGSEEKAEPFNLHRLLLQGAPFFGIPIGLGVAFGLWAMGWLARQLRWFELDWLMGNHSLLIACSLLGFSIGMFLRINAFFPDIKRSNLQVDPPLTTLLSDPDTLPIDSQSIRLTGTLLGRKGLQNWLYRDLMLQTPTGTIRLHYTSSFGWVGDLFPKAFRPPAMIDRSVSVTGWFRRGATPWIDVETIQTQQGRTARSYHPIWSTVLASGAALVAVYLIVQGG